MSVAWRLFAAACLFILIADGVQRSLPSGELRDFGSFVASARAGTEGRNPYGIHPFTFHVVLPGFDVWNFNLNPPVSVLVFRVFDAASSADAFRWWWTVSFVSYLLAGALTPGRMYPTRIQPRRRYSLRRVSAGWIRLMRRAGTPAAAVATMSTPRKAEASITGSVVVTP